MRFSSLPTSSASASSSSTFRPAMMASGLPVPMVQPEALCVRTLMRCLLRSRWCHSGKHGPGETLRVRGRESKKPPRSRSGFREPMGQSGPGRVAAALRISRRWSEAAPARHHRTQTQRPHLVSHSTWITSFHACKAHGLLLRTIRCTSDVSMICANVKLTSRRSGIHLGSLHRKQPGRRWGGPGRSSLKRGTKEAVCLSPKRWRR